MRRGGGWDCLDLCCEAPKTCDRVCPRRRSEFPWDMMDVRGFSPSNVGALTTDSQPSLPRYIPVLQGKTRRTRPLSTPWAALPLNLVCTQTRRRRQYRCKFTSKGDLLGHFSLGLNTRVLLLCIGKDRHLERYWKEKSAGRIPRQLASAGIDAAISPNFSFFLDEPLTQHIYNRKRSWLCAAEFAEQNIPPIVYLHALSGGDWKLLGDFLRERSDVQLVCKEFQTGGVRADHRKKIRYVAELEQYLGRSLHLVAVGGARFVPELEKRLTSWTVVDSTPYMRTIKGRRRARPGTKRLNWTPDPDTPIDDLIAHNIGEYRRWIQRLRSRATKVA